ncbi:MAG: peptidoglycan-binding protein [Defluviitaleaceae bacterium]|nr:peptidoglycan-binding protein [Defluviitaleaceae bacterium]MCL2262809.1 peptidoglycan-binding protein [Defluviitaleaceae bacterium]MCL2263875.1 peptidoglycan-binding protein [Defluviitaleaceae bacterium]
MNETKIVEPMWAGVEVLAATIWPPYPGVVLRRGMQGPSIRQVQERLNELGATPRLATDGIFGVLTEAAVMAFQRTRDLNPDGVVGPLTWNALFSTQPVTPPAPPAPQPVWPPYPGVVLRRGMQGPSIRQVQERLNELGATPRLATDGIFGALTSGVW